MKVFLSWSGPRSRFIAETLRTWIPRVIQSVKPWMSDEDISAGSRWLNEVSSELSEAKLGIICVTPENQANPWLLFEAGALSKTLDQTHVCPFLFELSPGQLSGPLSQFQANEVTRDGTYKIIQALNKSLGPAQIPLEDLDEIFGVWWPKLENCLAKTPRVGDGKIPVRSTEEILEEIVANTREQLRRENLRLELSRERDEKHDQFLETMQSSMQYFQNLKSLPKMLASLAPRSAEVTPEDMTRLVGSLPMPDMSAMQKVFTDMKEMSEKNKQFTENVLNGQKNENPPSEGT